MMTITEALTRLRTLLGDDAAIVITLNVTSYRLGRIDTEWMIYDGCKNHIASTITDAVGSIEAAHRKPFPTLLEDAQAALV